jgi:proteasome assembly chaperone (PAC2) family protein
MRIVARRQEKIQADVSQLETRVQRVENVVPSIQERQITAAQQPPAVAPKCEVGSSGSLGLPRVPPPK